MNLNSIAPVVHDYLKAIWTATEWGDPPITTKTLASQFGASPANVTTTMKRLAAQGLVHYRPYKPAKLTDTGAQLAVGMVRRHRLIETLLVTTLGYRWDETHEEAERLERAASDQLVDRIDTLLGRPTTAPRGDPIPTVDGHTHMIDGAKRLNEAEPGRHQVHRVFDPDPEILKTAADLGIFPGIIIEMHHSDGRITLTTSGGLSPLPPSLAATLWTTPECPMSYS